jgi:hypothetical protein
MAFLAAAGRCGGASGTVPALQHQDPASVGAMLGRSGDPCSTRGVPVVRTRPSHPAEPRGGMRLQ